MNAPRMPKTHERMMTLKRILCAALILTIICAALTGCAAQAGGQQPPQTAAGKSSAPVPPKEEMAVSADLTLAAIKKAAEAAGYIVSDGHQYILMDDIVDGLTIEIVADGAHTLYSVAECATEEAAKKNAKEINDAGYSISLRNGRFISSFDAENKGEDRKALLTAILAGSPLPVPPYPDGTQSTPAQTQESPDENLAGIPAYDPGAIPDDGMQEGEGFVENGELYIRILGIEKKLLDDQPGIVLNYEMTNLSGETVDTQTLYVEVLQNGEELRHPYTFEPVYLTIAELAPGETLAFHDEYLLKNETDPVEAKIRQFLVMVLDPPWVYKTFPLA